MSSEFRGILGEVGESKGQCFWLVNCPRSMKIPSQTYSEQRHTRAALVYDFFTHFWRLVFYEKYGNIRKNGIEFMTTLLNSRDWSFMKCTVTLFKRYRRSLIEKKGIKGNNLCFENFLTKMVKLQIRPWVLSCRKTQNI